MVDTRIVHVLHHDLSFNSCGISQPLAAKCHFTFGHAKGIALRAMTRPTLFLSWPTVRSPFADDFLSSVVSTSMNIFVKARPVEV